MKKIITGICLIFIACTLSAYPLKGIQIESMNKQIIVYLNGEQVSLPTFSCFIANLRKDYYTVEVFSAGYHSRRNELLFKDRIFFNGDLKQIIIEDDECPLHDDYNAPYLMNDHDFKDFYQRYSKLNFSSDKKAFIEHAMLTTNFSVNQCLSLLEALSFSSDKKELIKNIYPNISDKQNFYRILDSFTFQSDKNEIDNYIREHYYR